jgi:DNA-binding response OmpR family regulator
MTMADLLVVEDDPDTGEALVAILRAYGHVVRIAYDGEHGLRLLKERLPDVALLDVEMPVLDGPGMVVSMLIRDAGLEKVPIVLLSGVPDLRAVAARVGTPYYLAKPFPFAALDELLGRALSERTPPSPNPS